MLPMHHRSLAAMLVAAVVAVMALLGTPAAHAQFPPPCGAANLTITNFTPCDIKFCLKGFTGGVTTTFCWFAPAAQTIVVPYPLGFNPGGVVNTGNNTTYPFVPHPFIAGLWWVPNITLGACCCDVFYDPATCTMTIRLTTSPPPCQ